MLLNNFLEVCRALYPDKIALVCDGRRLTYEEIDNQANRLAHMLLRQGLERGERVGILLDNCIESVISLFGILKAGGVFVMFSPTLKEKKLGYILDHCDAKIVISSPQKLPLIQQCCTNAVPLNSVLLTGESPIPPVHDMQVIPWNVLAREATAGPAARNADSDLASIIYTSGSTGIPKGVMMTHANMAAAAASIAQYLENTCSDIILNVLPLCFGYGLYQVLVAFMVGATVVLEKSFAYPFKIIELLGKEQVTGFPMVPTIAAMLVRMENLEHRRFASLRYITNAGAAMPVRYTMRLRALFPAANIFLMYGLTECQRVCYLPPDEVDRRPASVGWAMPGVAVSIVKESGATAAPGEVGELVVQGPNVMQGYWKDPAATAEVLKPGATPGKNLLFTGDLFKTDEKGFLHFVSRKDDLIKCRGERVSPKEIEDFLCSIDGVAEAAVIGVDDEILGQAIRAYVVLNNGHRLDEKQVMQQCARGLEIYMVPQSVVFCTALPKTENGKIDKKLLKAGYHDSPAVQQSNTRYSV